MHKDKYPIISDSFVIPNEGIFRFFRNQCITYWNNTNQQGVEKLIDNKWEKLSYEESSRIAKIYLNHNSVKK